MSLFFDPFTMRTQRKPIQLCTSTIDRSRAKRQARVRDDLALENEDSIKSTLISQTSEASVTIRHKDAHHRQP